MLKGSSSCRDCRGTVVRKYTKGLENGGKFGKKYLKLNAILFKDEKDCEVQNIQLNKISPQDENHRWVGVVFTLG